MAGDLQGLIDPGLVAHRHAILETGIGTHHQRRARIDDAAGQAGRCEAAEHHRVHRANACAGQHGDGGLGHHGQIYQHPVTAPHPALQQDGGHRIDLAMQLAIAQYPLVAAVLLRLRLALHLVRNADQGRLFRPRRQMAVHGVMAEIGQPADKPACKRRPAVIENLIEIALPADAAGLLAPETLRVLLRVLHQAAIGGTGGVHGRKYGLLRHGKLPRAQAACDSADGVDSVDDVDPARKALMWSNR